MEPKMTAAGNPLCEIPQAGPWGLVIFGASGDLTRRKLIPAVFNLVRRGNDQENFFVLGVARSPLTVAQFREAVTMALKQVYPETSESVIGNFASHCFYLNGDYGTEQLYRKIGENLRDFATTYHTLGNVVFNLAIPPELYEMVTGQLGRSGLVRKGQNENPFQRLMVEKPFGRDLPSAVHLNQQLLSCLDDSQIFRIDHYLGKETVQNILVFRFANSIFERVWNRDCIDHVEITVAEELGVEHRASYFERAGLLRDMLQNHIMQLLSLVAMEPPVSFAAERIRDEKAKVFRALRAYDLNQLGDLIVRGQYAAGTIQNQPVPAYRREPGVAENSCVETFFATKLFIDNWRWQGVPFYLRAGKRMARQSTRIVVVFKTIPTCLSCHFKEAPAANVLEFSIQPGQGVSLKFQAKVPGTKLCTHSLDMNFNYQEMFGSFAGSDYSAVFLDCLIGDQTIFWRRDEIELCWGLLTPVLDQWEAGGQLEKNAALHMYPAGSRGPEAALTFIRSDGREWFDL